MLWAAAQTADSQIYHKPGSRERITNRLYSLALSYLHRRDMDSWHRVNGTPTLNSTVQSNFKLCVAN